MSGGALVGHFIENNIEFFNINLQFIFFAINLILSLFAYVKLLFLVYHKERVGVNKNCIFRPKLIKWSENFRRHHVVFKCNLS